ncbi:MAG: TonB-dependent receptor [Candidatus Andeanibacterium colombiense]|uniref:TonB-dependent receptor n=1 Tax=Candidatus Andeanibacterium colombiense TaxID=3121345 RepID=A0AAJ5X6S5_9SPHN|nr:MAG: TonB-dependent receptor [Sphingomonadaceae bacterium]
MSHAAMRASASLAVLGAIFAAASPAFAEDDQDKAEIVVSAKNPGSDTLDYPGSIDTIGTTELAQRQVQDLSTLSYAAPNVSLDSIGTFKGVANFAIRGLGINSSIPSIDPAVGIFVDGVYQGINAGDVFDLLDVKRVTVLRGPQGVAFGRNTTGGAVLVETADPTFAGEGHAGMTVEGPVDSRRGKAMLTMRGAVSGPLNDTLAIRIAALHSDDAGYFENDYDGRAFGKAVTTEVRGGLTWLASERLSFTLKGEWDKSDGDGAPAHNNGLSGRDNFRIAIDERGFYHSKGGSVSLRGEYELGQGKLTNVFGWRDYDLRTRNDIDSTPVKIFHSDTRTNQDQWSDELYYAADYGAVAVTAGGYIFHQQVGYDEFRDLAAPQYGGGVQDQDVYGLYAQADYSLTDKLTLTGGLRWSREEKSADITYVRPRAECSAIEGTCPIEGQNVPGENNGFSDSRAWNSLSPKVALAFKPTVDSNLYASWTRGYRSGGYNLRITQPAAFEQIAAELGSPAFDQERVDSFELGGKWQRGILRLSGALYWMEVANLQREINVPSLTSGLAQSIYNTADARIRGGELEATLTPAGGLTLTADLGYTDAQYRKVFLDLNSDGVINAADLALALPRAPKWSWGGSAAYEAELGGLGSLTASAFFQHRSAYAYTDNNWGYNSASDRLDASLALKLAGSGITLTVFGRNLTDAVQFGGDTQLAFAGGAYSDGDNRPFDPHPAAGTFSPLDKGRELGVGLNWDF